MKLLLAVVLISLLGASTAAAEPLNAGQRYEGPKTLEVGAFQASFELPAGWAGTLPPGTDWFHVGKDDQVGRVFVWMAQGTDADVRNIMTQGFAAGGAVMLTPAGELRTEGASLVGDYQANDGMTTFKAQARAQTRGGVAVAVVAVAPPEQFAQYQKLAVQIEKSLKFGVTPKASAGTGGGQWAQILNGRRVARYHTSGDYSEKTQFDLCTDGRFYKRFSGSSVNNLGSGLVKQGDGGAWSVQGNQLILRWSNGEVSQHLLEDRGGQLFVDGTRWLMAGQAICG